MKRKNILSIALVLLLIAITTLTFAYWDELFGEKENNFTIGEGKTITITETLNNSSGVTLIPSEALQGVNDVYEINFTYKVTVDQTLAANALNGYNFIVKLMSLSDTTGLVNLNVNGTTWTKDNVNATVSTSAIAENIITIVVTLSNPADLTEYLEIRNKEITFALEVSLSK